MTDKQQEQDPAVFLSQRYFTPVFFEKLAANGIRPNNEQEAMQLLQLGAILDQAATAQAATPGEGNPFLDHAIKNAAALAGEPTQPTQEVNDAELLKQAAAVVAEDEESKQAALAYLQAVASAE